jgi:soluble lytic murein transglycosylase-like protein
MTTGLSATLPMFGGYQWHLELSRARAVLLALLAALSIALVFIPASRVDGPSIATSPQASGAISFGQADTPEPGRAPAVVADTRAEIDALAILVAKKYRISVRATRDLIGAAYREGHRIGIDPLLILAVISVESRFNPIAESDMGAMGLMQIIPAYHQDKFDAAGGASALDPLTNIRVGARVLKDYIERGGTEIAGLQRYNGSANDAKNAYANKVLGEKLQLQQAVAVQRAHDQT